MTQFWGKLVILTILSKVLLSYAEYEKYGLGTTFIKSNAFLETSLPPLIVAISPVPNEYKGKSPFWATPVPNCGANGS